jgi:eukaryotic-like serine/threonine-protein kinase
MSSELANLRQFIIHHYSLEEVRTLCFDLGVNYDELGGEGISAKVRELLLRIGHRQQFDQLLNLLHQTRPNVFGLAESNTASTFLDKLYAQLPSSIINERRPPNEQILLDKVKSFWVEGVLEKSLHGIALIELGKDVRPDAVDYPWEMVVQSPYSDPEHIDYKKPIVDVFDDLGGALLILGEPGSGKTTMLLDLARAKIERAEHDPSLPVPVVFNLSAWLGDKTIAEWLIDELSEKYLIPKGIGRVWIESDRLLILLDGLDEVKKERQSKCVEAINHFRQEHGLGQIAVCSRIEEYQKIIQEIQRLKFESAIFIRPLTPQQIDEYLQSGGPKLDSVRSALKTDPFLEQIVQSPLMLSIVALAYRGISSGKLQLLNSVEPHRNFLFSTFVQQMLKRRRSNQQYTSEQTIQWLSWLAQKMTRQSLTMFLIEGIQPNWLPSPKQRFLYALVVMLIVSLPIGAFVGIGTGFPVWLFSEELGKILSFGAGVASILAIWLAVNRVFGLTGGLIVGSVTGLAFGLTFHLPYGQITGISIGLAIGGITGITFGFAGSLFKGKSNLYDGNIQIFETLSWSSSKSIQGTIIGVIIGAVFGLSIWLAVGQPFGLRFGLAFTLAFGLASGLVASLLSGLTGGEANVRVTPNQGIWQSGKNAGGIGLFVGMIVGLLVGLASGWTWGLAFGATNGVRVGLVTGLTIGLAFGLGTALFFGGLTFVQHFVLRFILYKNGYIPWDYVHFLDYAAEHLFLRKVGGGYIFIHRTLMEFFATLETSSPTKLTPDREIMPFKGLWKIR